MSEIRNERVCEAVDSCLRVIYGGGLVRNAHSYRLGNSMFGFHADKIRRRAVSVNQPVGVYVQAIVEALARHTNIRKPTIASLTPLHVHEWMLANGGVEHFSLNFSQHTLIRKRREQIGGSYPIHNRFLIASMRREICEATVYGLELAREYGCSEVIPRFIFNRHKVSPFALYSIPTVRGCVASGVLKLAEATSSLRRTLRAVETTTEPALVDAWKEWTSHVSAWEKALDAKYT